MGGGGMENSHPPHPRKKWKKKRETWLVKWVAVATGFYCPVNHTWSPQDSQAQVISKCTFLISEDSQDWKYARVLAVAVSVGRLFQSMIVRGVRGGREGKFEILLQYGTGYWNVWPYLKGLLGWLSLLGLCFVLTVMMEFKEAVQSVFSSAFLEGWLVGYITWHRTKFDIKIVCFCTAKTRLCIAKSQILKAYNFSNV